MNYRHAFHAGNFADVVKHAVLARIINYLKQKPAAFRVIDTHAGAGLYDLAAPEAARTGEWHDGVGRLMAAELAPVVRGLLAPYCEVIAAFNEAKTLKIYPGSPALVQCWLRPQDRLIACEREPNATGRGGRPGVDTARGAVLPASRSSFPPSTSNLPHCTRRRNDPQLCCPVRAG